MRAAGVWPFSQEDGEAHMKRGTQGFFIRIVITVATLGTPGGVSAQALLGEIDGNVTDSSQAVIVGARVAATNLETNFNREAITNSAGGYSLPGLPPGTYKVSVSAPGFQTYNQTGAAVSPNAVLRVDVTLTVGQLSETVAVIASAAALQTDRSDVRAEMTQQTLANVPVPIGRNYQMLFVTLPGVSPAQNANSFAANPTRSINFSANGAPTNINSTRIDGASSGGIIDSALTYIPSLEAIQEVNVVTNSFDAEQGLAGGAAVSIQIKSGSNSLHGSLFEYHTDQHLKAYQWAADRTQPNPKYINNQYGASLGGPIRRDKLFYFASFEGTGYSESVTQVVQVPTVAMKAGNLSGSPTPIYDPATGSPDGGGRTPFPNNAIPADRIDRGVQSFLNQAAQWAPNQPGSGALGLARNFSTSASNYQWRRQYDDKLTWNPTEKLSTFYRFGLVDHNAYTNGIFGSLGGLPISRANTGSGFVQGHLFQGTISATYVVSTNLVLDANYGYFREDFNDIPIRAAENLGSTVLQVPGLQSSDPREIGWPLMLIDGFSQVGAANNFEPHGYRDPSRVYAANMSWNKGSHNLRFGADINLQDINESQPQGINSYTAGPGGFQFSQGATQLKGGPAGNDYNAFASFLLGLPVNAGKLRLFPDDIQTRMKAYSFYARDRWQVTPKFTVNYGLRWEYFPFPTRVGRGLEVYDFENNVVNLCGLGPNPIDCGISTGRGRPAPRAGIAYRVSDTFVIRAGYGLTNDPINFANFQRLNYPDVVNVVLNAPNTLSYAISLRQGFPAIPRPDLSTGFSKVAGNVNLISFDKNNLVRGYLQSWNFTIEKRLAGWITSAGYVATRSVDQLAQMDQNWSPIGTGTSGEILNQKFGRTAPTSLMATLGTAKYDSLQVHTEHRFAEGYQVSVGYTFAHGRGYTNESSGAVPTVGLPYAYRKNYGSLNRDIRHNLQVSWVAELPFGRGKHWVHDGPTATILGGWQLSSVLSAYTGMPFSATASNASLNSNASGQFADCLAAPARRLGDIYQWYSKADFGVPASGRFGTCGQNSLSGPALVNLDMGLDRRFRFTERFELRLRAESFNLANTPHHANPGATSATSTSVNSGSFMLATDIRNTGRDGLDERTFRVGLKLSW
ncbi:MAG: hypothetical protein C5B51_14470 [Terriglobia bacterium]|nr:MAG: hypothetical protein C5B51_14470 [Terriglobia bacterium]